MANNINFAEDLGAVKAAPEFDLKYIYNYAATQRDVAEQTGKTVAGMVNKYITTDAEKFTKQLGQEMLTVREELSRGEAFRTSEEGKKFYAEMDALKNDANAFMSGIAADTTIPSEAAAEGLKQGLQDYQSAITRVKDAYANRGISYEEATIRWSKLLKQAIAERPALAQEFRQISANVTKNNDWDMLEIDVAAANDKAMRDAMKSRKDEEQRLREQLLQWFGKELNIPEAYVRNIPQAQLDAIVANRATLASAEHFLKSKDAASKVTMVDIYQALAEAQSKSVDNINQVVTATLSASPDFQSFKRADGSIDYSALQENTSLYTGVVEKIKSAINNQASAQIQSIYALKTPGIDQQAAVKKVEEWKKSMTDIFTGSPQSTITYLKAAAEGVDKSMAHTTTVVRTLDTLSKTLGATPELLWSINNGNRQIAVAMAGEPTVAALERIMEMGKGSINAAMPYMSSASATLTAIGKGAPIPAEGDSQGVVDAQLIARDTVLSTLESGKEFDKPESINSLKWLSANMQPLGPSWTRFRQSVANGKFDESLKGLDPAERNLVLKNFSDALFAYEKNFDQSKAVKDLVLSVDSTLTDFVVKRIPINGGTQLTWAVTDKSGRFIGDDKFQAEVNKRIVSHYVDFAHAGTVLAKRFERGIDPKYPIGLPTQEAVGTPTAAVPEEYAKVIDDSTQDPVRRAILRNLGATESGFRNVAGPKTDNAGKPLGWQAQGYFQWNPETAKTYGVTPGDFASEVAGVNKYLDKLLAENGGDYRKALAIYGGHVKADPTDYLAKVLRGVQLPAGQGGQAPAAPVVSAPAPAVPASVQEQPAAAPTSVTPPTAQPTAPQSAPTTAPAAQPAPATPTVATDKLTGEARYAQIKQYLDMGGSKLVEEYKRKRAQFNDKEMTANEGVAKALTLQMDDMKDALGILGRIDGKDYLKDIPADVQPTTTTKPTQPPNKDSLRADGTQKGKGYFGELIVPGTKNKATEYSIGVNIDGKEVQIPSLVPTLTPAEIVSLLEVIKNNGPVPKNIADKAIAHAKERMKQGKSPFAQDGEQRALPSLKMPSTPLVTDTTKRAALDKKHNGKVPPAEIIANRKAFTPAERKKALADYAVQQAPRMEDKDQLESKLGNKWRKVGENKHGTVVTNGKQYLSIPTKGREAEFSFDASGNLQVNKDVLSIFDSKTDAVEAAELFELAIGLGPKAAVAGAKGIGTWFVNTLKEIPMLPTAGRVFVKGSNVRAPGVPGQSIEMARNVQQALVNAYKRAVTQEQKDAMAALYKDYWKQRFSKEGVKGETQPTTPMQWNEEIAKANEWVYGIMKQKKMLLEDAGKKGADVPAMPPNVAPVPPTVSTRVPRNKPEVPKKPEVKTPETPALVKPPVAKPVDKPTAPVKAPAKAPTVKPKEATKKPAKPATAPAKGKSTPPASKPPVAPKKPVAKPPVTPAKKPVAPKKPAAKKPPEVENSIYPMMPGAPLKPTKWVQRMIRDEKELDDIVGSGYMLPKPGGKSQKYFTATDEVKPVPKELGYMTRIARGAVKPKEAVRAEDVEIFDHATSKWVPLTKFRKKAKK